MITEAQREFAAEVREKKRAASGVHARTGKRGYVGKMYLPFELLRGKEKRAYKKNGKVRTYKMIMDLEAFKALDKDGRKKHLEEILPNYTQQQIKNKWGIRDLNYYLRQADLVETKRAPRKGKEPQPQQLKAELQAPEIMASIADLQEALLKEQEEKEELKEKVQLLETQQAAQMETFKDYIEKHSLEMREINQRMAAQSGETEQLRQLYAQQRQDYARHFEQIHGNFSALALEVQELSKQNNSFNLSQPQQHDNEFKGRLKSLELDITLLKRLAIK